MSLSNHHNKTNTVNIIQNINIARFQNLVSTEQKFCKTVKYNFLIILYPVRRNNVLLFKNEEM